MSVCLCPIDGLECIVCAECSAIQDCVTNKSECDGCRECIKIELGVGI